MGQWDAAESISGSSNLYCTLGSVEGSILCIQAYICGLWPQIYCLILSLIFTTCKTGIVAKKDWKRYVKLTKREQRNH